MGQRLAADLKLPFLYKDAIKERLFDTLGWSDLDWSRRLGAATYEVLFYCLETLLQSGEAIIVESNFKTELHSSRFRTLLSQYGYSALQILCWSQGESLVKRFQERMRTAQRHPGHVDELNFSKLRQILLQGRQAPLDLPGILLEVDTTDFNRLDYAGLIAKILAVLEACSNTQQVEGDRFA